MGSSSFIVFLKQVFEARLLFVMSEYDPRIHGSAWAGFGSTLLVEVLTSLINIAIAYFIFTRPNAAERAAQKRHEWQVLQAGFEALERGNDLNSSLWSEFWETLAKHEARERALGHTWVTVFERYGVAAGGRRPSVREEAEHQEERETGAERGSFQQSPALHRASSPRRRSQSPVKADPMSRLALQFSGRPFQPFDGELTEWGESEHGSERAEADDVPRR